MESTQEKVGARKKTVNELLEKISNAQKELLKYKEIIEKRVKETPATAKK